MIVPIKGPCKGHNCDFCRMCLAGRCCGKDCRGSPTLPPHRIPHRRVKSFLDSVEPSLCQSHSPATYRDWLATQVASGRCFAVAGHRVPHDYIPDAIGVVESEVWALLSGIDRKST